MARRPLSAAGSGSARARRPDIAMLPEVQWISANEQALTDVIQEAIRR
jgi:hypothetical protein